MAAQLIRYARRRARFSQRQLAARSGILQPAIARIEAGRVVPRWDTVLTLLGACGLTLELRPQADVDRSTIRRLLGLTPRQRLELAVEEARNLERLFGR